MPLFLLRDPVFRVFLASNMAERFAAAAMTVLLGFQVYGLTHDPLDLAWLGLIEAAAGKIGSPMDQILLMCFHYDPRTGKYNVAIMNVIRTLGGLTVASLGTFMFVMIRRDRRLKTPAPVPLIRDELS